MALGVLPAAPRVFLSLDTLADSLPYPSTQLFIVEGAVSVFLGLVFAVVLPNKPETTSILSPIEREIVVARLKHEQGASDNAKDTGALEGFVLAVSDPKTWLITVMLYGTFVANSCANFFPSLVGSLGYSYVPIPLPFKKQF